MKRLIATMLLGVSSLFAFSASAAPIGLALVIDESGSISADNFALQRDAYASVLGSNLIATDGSLAIGVWKFDGSVEQVFATTLIDSQADKDALVAAINAMTQQAGSTAIGDAVTAAATGLINYGLGNLDKAIIDVSTDGQSNTGSNPTTASNQAKADGIDAVNCLAIGAGANCNWNPAGDLDFTAASFADFERILRIKIATETGQVPVPGALLLIGAGLVGFGLRKRFA